MEHQKVTVNGEDFFAIGNSSDIVKDRDRAVLFRLGESNYGASITKWIPKSQIWKHQNGKYYIPLWLLRNCGIWPKGSESIASGMYHAGLTPLENKDDIHFTLKHNLPNNDDDLPF